MDVGRFERDKVKLRNIYNNGYDLVIENKEKIFEDRLSYPWNWIPDSWTVCTFYCNSNRVCSACLFYGSYSFE